MFHVVGSNFQVCNHHAVPTESVLTFRTTGSRNIQAQCSFPLNLCYVLLLENISLYFVLQQVFELVTLGYIHASKCCHRDSVTTHKLVVPHSIPSFLNMTTPLVFLQAACNQTGNWFLVSEPFKI
jgi:hypothetical protein